MIILLTPTMLANDIVTTARFKIAQKLQVPLEVVSAKWIVNAKSGLDLQFDVDLANHNLGISEALIQTVIQTIWHWDYKRRLEWSLDNVKSVRQSR